jgi:hypothetical protein
VSLVIWEGGGVPVLRHHVDTDQFVNFKIYRS